MKNNKTHKIEVVLDPTLKQDFYAGCAKHGYSPSRLIRLMVAEKLTEWETKTKETLVDEMANADLIQDSQRYEKYSPSDYVRAARGC